MRRLYLDANGSSPPLGIAKAKLSSLLDLLGNPSSSHEHGRRVRQSLDEARGAVAQAVQAKEKQVIFTSGASEANRLFVDALKEKQLGMARPLCLVMSPFEHPSLYKPVKKAQRDGWLSFRSIELDERGALILDQEALERADALLITQAHNETGIVPDLEAFLGQLPDNVIAMSDISQGLARLAPPPDRVDVMTASAQKIGGFAGAGCAIFRGAAASLPPPWPGGGQEKGFRPGTESALLIAAFGEAASSIKEQRQEQQRLKELRDHFENEITSKADVRVIGLHLPRLSNTSAICFHKEDPDALRIRCDMAGLSVGFGSACSGLAPEGSFALKRLGLSEHEQRTTVRFSFSLDISPSDVEEAISRVLDQVLSHRSRV